MSKEAIISTSRLNSYGTRVLTEGIDLEQYRKNPVLLFMHRRGRPDAMPIGIMTNLREENGILYGTPKFDDDTEDERNISKKWERGTLRMLSAGLDVIEWSEDPVLLVQGQTRPTITKSKLIEVSVVDIGSNDDALQVELYHEGTLLTLAAGEDNPHLPLLLTTDIEEIKEEDNEPKKKNMEKILLQLGLPPTATEEEAVDAIKKIQERESALVLARITDTVDNAIKERRITAEKREKYLKLGQQMGQEALSELLADMTPVVKPMELIHDKSGEKGVNEKLSWENASSSQLAELRKNNREEYIRLYREYFGFAPEF